MGRSNKDPKKVYKSDGLSGVLNLVASSDPEVSWKASEYLRQRRADGKLRVADFTTDTVALQLQALGRRPASGDSRSGQQRVQQLQLLQMQAEGSADIRAVLQKPECLTTLLQLMLAEDAQMVRNTHVLLKTLCQAAGARRALRDADAVVTLVAALEKQRPVADLDVQGRTAGLLTVLTDEDGRQVSQLADATSQAGSSQVAMTLLQRMQASDMAPAMWPIACDLLQLMRCLSANSIHACQVLAREGAVAGMLALAAHPGVDAKALPLALAVLESVLAADPELHAPQLRGASHGISVLQRPLSPNRNLKDPYAAVLPAVGAITVAVQGDVSINTNIAAAGIIASLVSLLAAADGAKQRKDVTDKVLAALLAVLTNSSVAQAAALDAGVVPALLKVVKQSQGNHGYDRTTTALDALTALLRGEDNSGNPRAQQLFADEGGAAVVTSVLQRGSHDANEGMQQAVSGVLGAAAFAGGSNAAGIAAALVKVISDQRYPASPACISYLLETCGAARFCPGTPAALVEQGAPAALVCALQQYSRKGPQPDMDEAIAALRSIFALADASPDAAAALQHAGAVAVMEQVARDAKPGSGEANEAKATLQLLASGGASAAGSHVMPMQLATGLDSPPVKVEQVSPPSDSQLPMPSGGTAVPTVPWSTLLCAPPPGSELAAPPASEPAAPRQPPAPAAALPAVAAVAALPGAAAAGHWTPPAPAHSTPACAAAASQPAASQDQRRAPSPAGSAPQPAAQLAAKLSLPSDVWQSPGTVSSPPPAPYQNDNDISSAEPLSYIAACKLKGAPSGSVYSSGDYSTGSGDYGSQYTGGSGSYGDPSVHELHQAQARTIAQVTAEATLAAYSAWPAAASAPQQLPEYGLFTAYGLQPPPADTAQMQPYVPVSGYGAEAMQSGQLMFQPAPYKHQAVARDVKLAGKLLGQLVMAQDAEERADVMDTLEYKLRSKPGFSAGLERMKATMLHNGQTATVSLLSHCASAPMQDPHKLDRTIASMLSRLAAPEDSDDLADNLDTLHHKAYSSEAWRAALHRSPGLLFVLRSLAQDGHTVASWVLECSGISSSGQSRHCQCTR